MNHIFFKFKNISIIALLVTLILYVCVIPQKVSAIESSKGGIAISGSFYRHHFRMVPGESFNSPDVNIVVFNNYDKDITVKFNTEVPNGVKIDLEASQVEIPANDSIKFPVKLSVADTVAPGGYIIAVSAEVLPNAAGINVVSSAQIRSNLTVFGKAAWVKINTVNNEKQPFIGEIHLFYKEAKNLLAAGYSQTSELSECVIPGEYTVQVLWKGNEVANDSFNLKVDEKKDITLEAQTVFINEFTVNSQNIDKEKSTSSMGITYTIKNIYSRINDVRLLLKVYYTDESEGFKSSTAELDSNVKPIEEIEMLSLPTMEVGSQSGRGNYVPTKGWKKGIYRFRLDFYGKGISSTGEIKYAGSPEVEVSVKKSSFTIYFFSAVFALMILGYMVYILKKRLSKKKL